MTVVNLTGQTGEQMAQALVAQGWTWDQVREQYPQLFGAGGAGLPAEALGEATLQPPAPSQIFAIGTPYWPEEAEDTGTDLLAAAGAALPPAVIAALVKLGIPVASLAAPLAALYGVSQMVGVQYPWETGPGEGFIAPWERDIVKDESGKWVTRETRPDLFNGAPSTALVPSMGVGTGVGATIVKVWSANGWPFAMDSTGRIHTVTKSGIRKSWKPYKSVVLGKNPSTKQLNGAIRKMVAFNKTHQKIQKLARRLK